MYNPMVAILVAAEKATLLPSDGSAKRKLKTTASQTYKERSGELNPLSVRALRTSLSDPRKHPPVRTGVFVLSLTL